MTLNLTDIYKICANVVERNNDKLKTFAALKFVEQFNDVALNKSIFYQNEDNVGVFYSKAWKDLNYPTNKTPFDYPALIAFQNTATVGVNFNPLYALELYTVRLDYDSSKAWEVLMTELDSYLVLVLRELQKYVYISSNEVTGWYHVDEVNSKEEAGTWTDIVRDGWLKERLKSRQVQLTRGYSETPKNLLTVGTEITIQGCI